MERVFNISPKSTHQWMSAQELNYGDVRLKIADDILLNGRELEDGINWAVVEDCVRFHSRGKTSTGRWALQRSGAVRFASIAVNMGWDMHSPEIVYMSGSHINWYVVNEANKSKQRVADVEEGRIRFEDAEQTDLFKAQQMNRSGMLIGYASKFNESLVEYGRQFLPNSDGYLEVLKGMTHLNRLGVTHERYELFELLKAGSFDQALVLLQA